MATSVQDALHRVHAWLDKNAPRIRDNLNAGASDMQIDQAEAALGIAMPADWHELYRIHDGLNDTGNFGNLFFGMQFMPLTRVLEEQTNSSTATSDAVAVKMADKGIKQHNMHNRRWIGLAHDFGDTQLRVDMDPSTDGRVGQVILTDHAYDTAILVGPSISEMLSSFADDLENNLYFLNKEALADGNQFLACVPEIDLVNWWKSPRWKHLSK